MKKKNRCESLLQKVLSCFFPSYMRENLSSFYIIRKIYKKLLKWNGIENISIVWVNDKYSSMNYEDDPNIEVVCSANSTKDMNYPQRLGVLLRADYFSKGSVLFAYIRNRDIIAYSWLHKNYDPDGDLDLISKKDFAVVGPVFVDVRYRSQGLGSKLNASIFAYMKNQDRLPVYITNQFDNIPIIKVITKQGYTLSNIIIRLRNKGLIVV